MKFKMQNAKCKIMVVLLCRTFYFSLALLTFNFLLFTFISPTYAQTPPPGVDIGTEFGYGHIKSLGEATSKLVIPVFSIATFIVVWYFLWGAWEWLISEGDKQKVADARNKITQAIIGFIILIMIFFILPFVLNKLFNANLGIIGF